MKATTAQQAPRLTSLVTRSCLTMALAMACGTTHAADRYWIGAMNNHWFNSVNWGSSVLPGDNDTAVFSDAGLRYGIDMEGGFASFSEVRFDSQTAYVIDHGSLVFGDLSSVAAGALVTHVIAADMNLFGDAIWTISALTPVDVRGAFDTSDGLTKTGSGTLFLGGSNNAVRGDLSIEQGEVILYGGSGYSDVDPIDVGAGGTLRLNNNETIGGLSGAGTVELESHWLTFKGNPDASFAGAITGGAASMLRMNGTGTQTLTGTAAVDGFEGLGGTLRIVGGTFTMPDDGAGEFYLSGSSGRFEVLGGSTALLPSTGSGSNPAGACEVYDNGQLLISGDGSSLLAGRVEIGGFATPGTLTVSSGGLLDVTLGSDPWLFVGANSVGNSFGSLRILGGGTALAESVLAGLLANNAGTVTVQGQGSMLDAYLLRLGGVNAGQRGGTGSLVIEEGGSVSLVNTLEVFTGSSSISVDGGRLATPRIVAYPGTSPLVEISDGAAGSALVLGYPGAFSSAISYEITDAAGGPGSIEWVGSGTLTLAHGGSYTGGLTVSNGNLRLQDAARQYGSLTGSGPVVFEGLTLDGTGVIGGSVTLQGGGALKPSTESGTGIGRVECDSLQVADPGSALDIQLGGTNSFDQVYVEGTATLGGSLNLSYTNGFAASPGDWFEIVDAGEMTGAFFAIQWPDSQDWAAYEAGGSLWVGVCDGSTTCLADCIDEVQVFGPRTAAESVIGDGTIVVLNRGPAGIEIVDATGPTVGATLATIPVSVSIPANSRGMALGDSVLAIAGLQGGYLIDVSDPANPIQLNGITAEVYDVAIWQHLLAVSHADGLSLIDISNPAAATWLSDTPAPLPYGGSGTVTFHNGMLFWSWQSDDFFTGEVVILDVTNPASPVELGSIAANFFVSEPQFKDNIMLLSNDNSLRAIDISDVTHPTQVASLPLPGIDQEAALMGGLLYRISTAGLTVFDVTDPASPVEIDNLVGFAADDGVSSIAGRLYLVGASGLSVIDAGDMDSDGVTD
ncbi:MAG: hypothetical protein KDA21_12660, partial [Phycisphaerales bacterium]|nr:hypothetical protein [Phycisphaerales bacterium]